MNEGWIGDDYLILFEESEVATLSDRYTISQFLPGFRVLGLRGWDDFIVRDSQGNTFTIPTVPIDAQYLAPFAFPEQIEKLHPDVRFTGKIKWYVQPIFFGGDPGDGKNLIWVSLQKHVELVLWWNDPARSVSNTGGTIPRA
jgi:hypothetical protein